MQRNAFSPSSPQQGLNLRDVAAALTAGRTALWQRKGQPHAGHADSRRELFIVPAAVPPSAICRSRSHKNGREHASDTATPSPEDTASRAKEVRLRLAALQQLDADNAALFERRIVKLRALVADANAELEGKATGAPSALLPSSSTPGSATQRLEDSAARWSSQLCAKEEELARLAKIAEGLTEGDEVLKHVLQATLHAFHERAVPHIQALLAQVLGVSVGRLPPAPVSPPEPRHSGTADTALDTATSVEELVAALSDSVREWETYISRDAAHLIQERRAAQQQVLASLDEERNAMRADSEAAVAQLRQWEERAASLAARIQQCEAAAGDVTAQQRWLAVAVPLRKAQIEAEEGLRAAQAALANATSAASAARAEARKRIDALAEVRRACYQQHQQNQVVEGAVEAAANQAERTAQRASEADAEHTALRQEIRLRQRRLEELASEASRTVLAVERARLAVEKWRVEQMPAIQSILDTACSVARSAQEEVSALQERLAKTRGQAAIAAKRADQYRAQKRWLERQLVSTVASSTR